MASKEEGQGQNNEDTKETHLHVGAKDGEPLAEAQRHNREPGRAPDKDQGDHDFDNCFAGGVAKKLIVGIAKPENLNRADGGNGKGASNPERVGDPVEHCSQRPKETASSHLTPLVDATLLSKGAAEFGGKQAIREQKGHSGDEEPGKSLSAISCNSAKSIDTN